MLVQSLTGQVIGQYELFEMIGRGGMGAVYRAYQHNLGREVAFKVLLENLLSDLQVLKRFQHEARAIAMLEHVNIVPVFDSGTIDGISYVTMRLLNGGSLADRIANSRETPLSLQEIAEILLQLGDALDYAHSKGVIHRDIKPSNILFDERNIPYLVDFGIAKLVQNATNASMTTTGNIVGTLPFVAPEQLRGDETTPASDQYSLAVTLYLTLTGNHPFDANTPHSLIHNLLYEAPKPLITYRSDIPDAIEAVLKQALAKTPDQRFPNNVAFAEAFYAAIKRKTDTTEHATEGKPTTLHLRGYLERLQNGQSATSTSSVDLADTNDGQPAIITAAIDYFQRIPSKFRWGTVAFLVAVVTMGLIYSSVTRSTATNNTIVQVVATIETTAEVSRSAPPQTETPRQGSINKTSTQTPSPCRVYLLVKAYIRVGPGVDFDFVRSYDPGWEAHIVAKSKDKSGEVWWKVYVSTLEAEYWVADSVTEEKGDCQSIPWIGTQSE